MDEVPMEKKKSRKNTQDVEMKAKKYIHEENMRRLPNKNNNNKPNARISPDEVQ